MKYIKRILISAVFLACAGCGTPVKPEPRFQKEQWNVSYGTHLQQKMDLVFPDAPDYITQPLNAVLFIHGGGWASGDKSDYSGLIQTMANTDFPRFAAASMNYRMFGDNADCEDMLEDISSALEYMKSYALKFGVTINKVFLMGASAGGHLSLLYAYKNYSISPVPVAFVVSQAGPADFTDPNVFGVNEDFMYFNISKLTGIPINAGNKASYQNEILSVSPIHYVSADIPTLMAYGRLDGLVPFSNAERLKSALDGAGCRADLLTFPNSGHDLSDPADAPVSQEFFLKLIEYIAAYM